MKILPRIAVVSTALFSIGGFAVSENTPTVLNVQGCDPALSDPNGDVTLLCHGLKDEHVRVLPKVMAIVETLLKTDLTGSSLDARLEDVLAVAQKGREAAAQVSAAAPEPAAKESKKASPPAVLYNYRGFQVSAPGSPATPEKGESAEYAKLLELQKSNDWKRLLKESSREIKRVPEWLTPYAFKAVALVRLGKQKEAIELMHYVDQHSAGNPEYDQVRAMLKRLEP